MIEMSNKFIIAVIGEEAVGKTCTIRNVWEMLPACHLSGKHILKDSLLHEVWGYVEYAEDKKGFYPHHSKVGVASRGDNSEEIKEWVIPLIEDYECEIVVCACHSSGDDTLTTVKSIAWQHDYELITVGNFTLYKDYQNRESLKSKIKEGKSPVVEVEGVNLSRLSAKSIVELIEMLNK